MAGAKTEQLQIRVTRRQKAALKRLARAAGCEVSGYVLSRVLPEAHARFAGILDLLRADDHRFGLAELNDFLASLAPVEFAEAVGRADVGRLSVFLQNYVAAMVEQAAGQKGVAPPSWVRSIPPLETPHFATSLESLRLHLLRTAPVAFKRRNIFADAGVGARV